MSDAAHASSTHPYALLATLLDYPSAKTVPAADACRAAIASSSAEAASGVEAFGTFCASTDPRELEEFYARTFDFQPTQSLDLGYQLFGESYKRGVFLVKVQGAAKAHGVLEQGKLADNLTVVLRLLPRLTPGEAHSLVDEVVLPVLAKVLKVFSDSTNPYRMVLEAVKAVLAADFRIEQIRPIPEERPAAVPPGMQFLGRPLAANRHDEGGLQ